MADRISTRIGTGEHRDRARTLFSSLEWTNAGQAIANLMIPFAHMAFRPDHLYRTLVALNGLVDDRVTRTTVDREVERPVRAKVLRRRRHNREALIEVNL